MHYLADQYRFRGHRGPFLFRDTKCKHHFYSTQTTVGIYGLEIFIVSHQTCFFCINFILIYQTFLFYKFLLWFVKPSFSSYTVCIRLRENLSLFDQKFIVNLFIMISYICMLIKGEIVQKKTTTGSCSRKGYMWNTI